MHLENRSFLYPLKLTGVHLGLPSGKIEREQCGLGDDLSCLSQQFVQAVVGNILYGGSRFDGE